MRETRIFQTHSKYGYAYARSVAELQRMLPALLEFRDTHFNLFDSDSSDEEESIVRLKWCKEALGYL